jgi:hypothetical protein
MLKGIRGHRGRADEQPQENASAKAVQWRSATGEPHWWLPPPDDNAREELLQPFETQKLLMIRREKDYCMDHASCPPQPSEVWKPEARLAAVHKLARAVPKLLVSEGRRREEKKKGGRNKPPCRGWGVSFNKAGRPSGKMQLGSGYSHYTAGECATVLYSAAQ